MRRRLFTFLWVPSLVLGVAAAAMWVEGRWMTVQVRFGSTGYYTPWLRVVCGDGGLGVARGWINIPVRSDWTFDRFGPVLVSHCFDPAPLDGLAVGASWWWPPGVG